MEDLRGMKYGHIKELVLKHKPNWNIISGTRLNMITHSLTLSHHLRLGLSAVLFSSGFPTNIFYAFLFCLNYATCPTHLILLYLII
jgi:hypothetical protein